jgi:hypothetical protein
MARKGPMKLNGGKKMWINRQGSNITAQQVCAILAKAAGAAYTPETLNQTFRCGAIYQNGGLWFQRIA